MESDYKSSLNQNICTQKPMYDWKDVTSEFFDSIKELELGELLHGYFFGLFEAMSAIEIMDPKMDAGMMCNRESKAIKVEDLKLKGLTVPEQISIIDITLACLVSWLEGHSLAQTVFTNLYFQKPYNIEDTPLKAFCICTYKIIESIRDFANRAQVFEEEDFQPALYNYHYFSEITEQRVIGMMREVNEELSNAMKSNDIKDNELMESLSVRIKFVRLFFQILLSFNRRENQLSSMGETQRLLTTCSLLIPLLIKTVDKGVSNDDDVHFKLGFDPLINQKLLPPTFPRYTKIKSPTDAYLYFDGLLTRLKQICKMTNCVTFISALECFIELGHNGHLCIVSRSIMQTLYFPQPNRVFGTQDLEDCLKEWAKSFIAPPSLVTRFNILSNSQAKDCVSSFFEHCTRPFAGFIQICGHNRARQRDKLAHLMEDFSALQDESQRVDAFLHTFSSKLDPPKEHLASFSTWIIYHTIRIMIMFLLSGFELELYSPHEYQYIYWYLYQFLYGWLVSTLNRADSVLYGNDSPSDSQKNRTKRNKTKKKKSHPYSQEIIMCHAMQSLTGAYFKTLVGFQLEGKIRPPKHAKFDNERVRYEHRFAAFSLVAVPPPFSYAEFQMTRCQVKDAASGDSGMLYLTGCELFHQARCLLDTLPQPHSQQVLDLIKVCKTNFVTMKLLAGGYMRGPKVTLDFDFSTNPCFPIFKLS
ncbi:N-alpha-acetyltransferase 35, NatC auxiliary subunit [Daktulosphaira vitifoliae]|uniref:N-alpha-acetyltransferase 35, NatC auxiliary subunit n=1 Tax=Daktulosphaira vitifoliae TaxID=58002 RepID=UPI0021A998DE|nr:N-alpha-acetyltransferase 35, NatC auxiliary subunit [Daktulosphaira vitifoliae]XP_050538033.1 N-alpha-acetyltransferase 35, NatC auxiliary subunit [Daktulosphaira vitifoliae]